MSIKDAYNDSEYNTKNKNRFLKDFFDNVVKPQETDLKAYSVTSVYYRDYLENHSINFDLKEKTFWTLKVYYLTIECPKVGVLRLNYCFLRGMDHLHTYMDESFPIEEFEKKIVAALTHYNSL